MCFSRSWRRSHSACWGRDVERRVRVSGADVAAADVGQLDDPAVLLDEPGGAREGDEVAHPAERVLEIGREQLVEAELRHELVRAQPPALVDRSQEAMRVAEAVAGMGRIRADSNARATRPTGRAHAPRSARAVPGRTRLGGRRGGPLAACSDSRPRGFCGAPVGHDLARVRRRRVRGLRRLRRSARAPSRSGSSPPASRPRASGSGFGGGRLRGAAGLLGRGRLRARAGFFAGGLRRAAGFAARRRASSPTGFGRRRVLRRGPGRRGLRRRASASSRPASAPPGSWPPPSASPRAPAVAVAGGRRPAFAADARPEGFGLTARGFGLRVAVADFGRGRSARLRGADASGDGDDGEA